MNIHKMVDMLQARRDKGAIVRIACGRELFESLFASSSLAHSPSGMPLPAIHGIFIFENQLLQPRSYALLNEQGKVIGAGEFEDGDTETTQDI